MTPMWGIILALAGVFFIGLMERGIETMPRDGAGALWEFFSALAIVGFVVWGYQHQRGPQKPPERR